jgi:ribose transport system substrate-binding protein
MMEQQTNGSQRRRTGRKPRVAAAGVLVAVMAFVAAGCGSSNSTTGTSSTTSNGTKAVSGKKIGVLSLCEACEGVHRMTTGMQQATKAAGWSMQLVDAQGAPDKAAAGMSALVQSGVDGIVIEAIEPALVKQGLQAAIAAKIPVVSEDVGGTTDGVLSDISPNEAANTKLLDQKMYALIGSKPAKIAAVRYMSLSTTAARYNQLVKDAKADGLTMVGSHDSVAPNFADDAASYTTQVLGANPDTAAIWTASTGDPAAVGAAKAVTRAKSNAIVVGYNGDMDALAAMRSGGPFKATVAFPVEEGSFIATDLLLKHYAGQTVPNKEIYLPASIVTKQNLPATGKYFNAWGDYGAKYAAAWKKAYGL